jgi:endonuclease/exonuclease/phosphatase family metal-dependent hydrolase
MLRLIPLFLIALLGYAQEFGVATYNVRYPSQDDGANVWENRKELFVRSVRSLQADLIGTQELFASQGDYLVSQALEYRWFGVSRRGDASDEHMGVFYRSAKFRLLESGNFWLSPTPKIPGSSAWGMTLPRMATWGLFEVHGGKQVYFVNRHFPHRREDDAARLECAKVLLGFVRQLPADVPVILTGDFNADIDSEPYRLLRQDLLEAAPKDATGTFHGFSGKPGRARIDWILYRGALSFEGGEVSRYAEDGKYPSDHFPVTAKFRFR